MSILIGILLTEYQSKCYKYDAFRNSSSKICYVKMNLNHSKILKQNVTFKPTSEKNSRKANMNWSIYLTQPSLLKVKQWGNNSFIALTFFKNVSLWLLESQGTSEIFTFNINRTLCKILLNTGNKSCYTRIEYEKIREYSVYMRIQEYTVMHFELIWIKSCIYIKNSIYLKMHCAILNTSKLNNSD